MQARVPNSKNLQGARIRRTVLSVDKPASSLVMFLLWTRDRDTASIVHVKALFVGKPL